MIEREQFLEKLVPLEEKILVIAIRSSCTCANWFRDIWSNMEPVRERGRLKQQRRPIGRLLDKVCVSRNSIGRSLFLPIKKGF
jgi:hypothetical protein